MKGVVYLAPIDYVTGKFPKVLNSMGMPTNMDKICGRKRTQKNNAGVALQTIAGIGKRSTPVTAQEVQNRGAFAAIAALCAQHRNNITSRQQDQAGFKAQTEYKTFNAYLWNVCKAEYEASLEDDEG